MRPSLSLLAIFSLVVVLLPACRMADRTFVRDTDLPAAGATHLVVRTDGGDVAVTPSTDGMLHVETHLRAFSQEDADALVTTIDVVGDEARVVYAGPTPYGEDVSFVVRAPAGLAVEARTSGGQLDVRGMTSGASLDTDGGGVHAQELVGALRITSGGGEVDVLAHRGSVVIETDGGNLHADGVLSGACSVTTAGGQIAIAIPQASALVVDARTDGGLAQNDFGLSVVSSDGEQSFGGTLGDGRDGSLVMRTMGGNVLLSRTP